MARRKTNGDSLSQLLRSTYALDPDGVHPLTYQLVHRPGVDNARLTGRGVANGAPIQPGHFSTALFWVTTITVAVLPTTIRPGLGLLIGLLLSRLRLHTGYFPDPYRRRWTVMAGPVFHVAEGA